MHASTITRIARLQEPVDPSYAANTPFPAHSPEHVLFLLDCGHTWSEVEGIMGIDEEDIKSVLFQVG